MHAIETTGLTKDYGNGKGLFGLDLEVREGEVFGFLGPNGAGKTTTIRLLMDMIRPTRGSARLLGLDAHERSVALKEWVGYLPGELPDFGRMRCAEIVGYVMGVRRIQARERIGKLCDRFAIDLGGDPGPGGARRRAGEWVRDGCRKHAGGTRGVCAPVPSSGPTGRVPRAASDRAGHARRLCHVARIRRAAVAPRAVGGVAGRFHAARQRRGGDGRSPARRRSNTNSRGHRRRTRVRGHGGGCGARIVLVAVGDVLWRADPV